MRLGSVGNHSPAAIGALPRGLDSWLKAFAFLVLDFFLGMGNVDSLGPDGACMLFMGAWVA